MIVIEAILGLLISMLAFGVGGYMVYQMFKDTEKWDRFWENQNRQRPLVPKNWPGSAASKLLSYLFAIVMLFAGFIMTISTILEIIQLMN
jgi:hypothetical protein